MRQRCPHPRCDGTVGVVDFVALKAPMRTGLSLAHDREVWRDCRTGRANTIDCDAIAGLAGFKQSVFQRWDLNHPRHRIVGLSQLRGIDAGWI